MSYQDAEKLRQMEKDSAVLREIVQSDQNRCSHDWSETTVERYEIVEGYGYRLVGSGSVPEYSKVAKMRWKRECGKCGKVQHSDKRKQKVIDDGPDFGE